MSLHECPKLLHASRQVEFSPTLQTLASVVNDIASHLFATISIFRRLPDILIKRKINREPIHVIVGERAVGRAHSGHLDRAELGGEMRAFHPHGPVIPVADGKPGQRAELGEELVIR